MKSKVLNFISLAVGIVGLWIFLDHILKFTPLFTI